MNNDKLHVNKHQIFANGCTIETYHKSISQNVEQTLVFGLFIIDDNSEYVKQAILVILAVKSNITIRKMVQMTTFIDSF